MRLFTFMVKRDLKKVEAVRAHEREMIKQIVSDEKKAA